MEFSIIIFSLLFYLSWLDFFAMHLMAWVVQRTTPNIFFVIVKNLEFSSHAHNMETLPLKKWFFQYLGRMESVLFGNHFDYDNWQSIFPKYATCLLCKQFLVHIVLFFCDQLHMLCQVFIIYFLECYAQVDQNCHYEVVNYGKIWEVWRH